MKRFSNVSGGSSEMRDAEVCLAAVNACGTTSRTFRIPSDAAEKHVRCILHLDFQSLLQLPCPFLANTPHASWSCLRRLHFLNYGEPDP
jgi:hypothetical protein